MRVLAGIQPSGKLHIGNYFGSMRQLINAQEKHDLFAFLVNWHALTTVRDKDTLEKNTIEAAATFLALGIDPEKCYFYIQSDIPAILELTWYLSTVTSMGLLERAHSYKDKIAKGLTPNAGLFYYPILMAADILAFQANKVPVGKDQKQHLEMTRDIAGSFNNLYGETFILPEPQIPEEVAIVPGIDGEKMSKSYDNYIEIFEEPGALKKKVMSIVTDSTPLEEPKDPETCNVFALYKLFATSEELDEMRSNYRGGGFGYGHAKKALLQKIKEYFEPYRDKYNEYISNPSKVIEIMKYGAEKASKIAEETLSDVREKVGVEYSSR